MPLALLFAGCADPEVDIEDAAPGGAFAIVNTTLVPMDHEGLLADHTVVVRDGRIEAIGPSEDVALPADAVRIDGSGRYVLPGLYDAHVHLDYEDELAYYLPSGVTTIVNLSGRPFHLELRDALGAGDTVGPRLVTCGPIIRGNDLDSDSAVALVREHAAAGYDCFKIYADWPGDVYRAAREATAEAGIQFVGHAPRNLPFDVVLESDEQRVVHLEEVLYTTPELQNWLDRYRRGEQPTSDQAPEVELAEALVDVAERTAQAGVWVVPTQIVLDYYADRSTEEGLNRLADRPYLRYLNPVSRRVWARADQSARRIRMERQVALQHAMLVEFRRAGVRMALGTDAGVEGDLVVMPGWSVHEEMDILVGLGYSPFEALQQATVRAAEYLERDGEGTIEVGNRADLIVVSSNPLEDVSSARDVRAAVVGGRWHGRASMQARLEELADRFARMDGPIGAIDSLIQLGDAHGAVGWLKRVEPASPQLDAFVERAINGRGYELLGEERFDEAIGVLAANVEAFPKSANTYDSLGEAYLLSGDRETAARYYREALVVDPDFANAARMLAQILSE